VNLKQLVPCPSCNRHVFAGECVCPFCATAMSGHACAPPAQRNRLGRAVRMAAAASLLGVSACSTGQSYGTMGGLDAGTNHAAAEQAASASTSAGDAPDGGTDRPTATTDKDGGAAPGGQ